MIPWKIVDIVDAAYIYTRYSDGTWHLVNTITPVENTDGTTYGESTAILNGTIVVSDPSKSKFLYNCNNNLAINIIVSLLYYRRSLFL